MMKLFGKKITYIHWILMGGVLAIVLLLLQYGYGGLTKTTVLFPRQQCIKDAQLTQTTCLQNAFDAYSIARSSITTTSANFALKNKEIADANKAYNNAKVQCETDYNAAMPVCAAMLSLP